MSVKPSPAGSVSQLDTCEVSEDLWGGRMDDFYAEYMLELYPSTVEVAPVVDPLAALTQELDATLTLKEPQLLDLTRHVFHTHHARDVFGGVKGSSSGTIRAKLGMDAAGIRDAYAALSDSAKSLSEVYRHTASRPAKTLGPDIAVMFRTGDMANVVADIMYRNTAASMRAVIAAPAFTQAVNDHLLVSGPKLLRIVQASAGGRQSLAHLIAYTMRLVTLR